ncbi:HD domain-containing protein [Sciscionella marina]|uniref:HD domain-containing protein n=1 Tax=Sciscionella marina TaxID=508770 RepID=UPI000475680D|nr:HD domain-containing protein [Sciscionella marina]
MPTADDAAALAEHHLAPLGRRWHHVRAVAARAADLANALPIDQRNTLVTAAWLHDIGYAPDLAKTGFHPLDGARFLRASSWPEQVVNLVAHHSGARFEAEERGLADELAAFPFEDSALLDALNTADLTTGPDGQRLAFGERMDEILHRYPENDPVHRTWVRARPIIQESIERTESRLSATQPR